ncbi:hypothetical protein B9Z48_14290 [Limnohabitans sp. WS1]|nr:hypothetical protein B9Z48_14290 [Limnohabitans sp. WS1]
MAHNVDKTDAVRLTIEILGDKENTTTNPNWVRADPDNNTTFFYFQLKDGERVGDANVLFLDGKRLSLTSGDGRFGINKDTGLITRLIDTPQYEEQTLDVVITDTALISTAVSVIIEANHRPVLTRGDENVLTLVVDGVNDGNTTNANWNAQDADPAHPQYFYFQLASGEGLDLANVQTIEGNRLSLVSADGRFVIDKLTGAISLSESAKETPQLENQALQVVITDTELVSTAVTVVVEQNYTPELATASKDQDPIHVSLAINATENDSTSDIGWIATDDNGVTHTNYFYFSVADGTTITVGDVDYKPMSLDGKFLSSVSADGRFKINSETGAISRTSSDQEDPVLLCKDEVTLSVVVTDTEFVSNAVDVTIERILPTFAEDYYEKDQQDLGDATNDNRYYFNKLTEIDKTIVLTDLSTNGNARGTDLLDINVISKFETLGFHKGSGEESLNLNVNFSHDFANDIEQVSITVENQFGLPDDIEGKATDGMVEFVKFSEGATYKGYVLNTADYDGLGEPETGVYSLQTGTTGTDCQDVLVSSMDQADNLSGGKDNDLLFGYGLSDTLNGGQGNDLLVANESENILNGDEGDDTLVSYGTKNTLNGGAGLDTLFAYGDEAALNGGDDDDSLTAEGEYSTLNGGSGKDTLHAHGYESILDGGTGDDTLHAAGDESTLHGGEGNDSLTAEGEYSVLNGDSGDDILLSTGYDSTLDGGDGDDSLTAEASGSSLNGGSGNDTLHAHADDSTLDGGDGDDTLHADGYNTTLDGGAGDDSLTADGAGSSLNGGSGDDSLFINADNACVIGGLGNDFITIAEAASNTSIVLKDSGDTNFDTISGFDMTGIIHLNGFDISFGGTNNNDEIDGVQLVNLTLNDNPMDYLDSEDNDVSYLIAVTGSDADIWQVNNVNEVITLDKVAHFVNFDFANYSVIPA